MFPFRGMVGSRPARTFDRFPMSVRNVIRYSKPSHTRILILRPALSRGFISGCQSCPADRALTLTFSAGAMALPKAILDRWCSARRQEEGKPRLFNGQPPHSFSHAHAPPQPYNPPPPSPWPRARPSPCGAWPSSPCSPWRRQPRPAPAPRSNACCASTRTAPSTTT